MVSKWAVKLCILLTCSLIIQITAFSLWHSFGYITNRRGRMLFTLNSQNRKISHLNKVSTETANLVAAKLAELRLNNVQSISFPANLNAIDRSYVHDVSSRQGYVSKSSGSGKQRCITVTKPSFKNLTPRIVGENAFTNISFSCMTTKLLQGYMNSPHAKNLSRHLHGSKAELFRDERDEHGRHRNTSLVHDLKHIKASYVAAQSRRVHWRGYEDMQTQRRTLPAYHYKSAVCDLVKNNTVVLVR